MSKIEIKYLNEEGGNSVLATPYIEQDHEKIAVEGGEKVLSPGDSAEFELETGTSGIDLQNVGQDAANAGDADGGEGDDNSGETEADSDGEGAGEEQEEQKEAA